MTNFRSGFIGIIGRPNVGKSTLLNRILDCDLAITSKKPQTTRNSIRGIYTREDECQIVFIDTPGIHKAKGGLNKYMVDAALSAMAESDCNLLIIDLPPSGSKKYLAGHQFIAERLQDLKKPVGLILNKADRLDNPPAHLQEILPHIDFDFKMAISALYGHKVKDLIQHLKSYLPVGPQYYPSDMLTDQAERFIAAEKIRQSVYEHTGQELPYCVAITINSFQEEGPRKEGDRGLIKMDASLHVERNSQKGMLIGKGGKKLKAIGISARAQLEKFFQVNIFVQLTVRVEKNWTRDQKKLSRLGYGSGKY